MDSYEKAYETIKQSREQQESQSAEKVTDAPVEKNVEKSTTDEPKQPNSETDNQQKKEFTPEEKAEFAFKKRFKKYDTQLEQLKKENAELRARLEPKAPSKTRADFKSDEEYANHVLEQHDKALFERFQKEQQSREAEISRLSERQAILQGSVEKLFGSKAKDIWAIVRNPESDANQVLNSNPILAPYILDSEFGAELLLDVCIHPNRYKRLAALPTDMQRMRLSLLEDEAERIRYQSSQKPVSQTAPQQREPLPNVGQFGVHGTGTQDISGLSPTERVERWKKTLRDKGLI